MGVTTIDVSQALFLYSVNAKGTLGKKSKSFLSNLSDRQLQVVAGHAKKSFEPMKSSAYEVLTLQEAKRQEASHFFLEAMLQEENSEFIKGNVGLAVTLLNEQGLQKLEQRCIELIDTSEGLEAFEIHDHKEDIRETFCTAQGKLFEASEFIEQGIEEQALEIEQGIEEQALEIEQGIEEQALEQVSESKDDEYPFIKREAQDKLDLSEIIQVLSRKLYHYHQLKWVIYDFKSNQEFFIPKLIVKLSDSNQTIETRQNIGTVLLSATEKIELIADTFLSIVFDKNQDYSLRTNILSDLSSLLNWESRVEYDEHDDCDFEFKDELRRVSTEKVLPQILRFLEIKRLNPFELQESASSREFFEYQIITFFCEDAVILAGAKAYVDFILEEWEASPSLRGILLNSMKTKQFSSALHHDYAEKIEDFFELMLSHLNSERCDKQREDCLCVVRKLSEFSRIEDISPRLIELHEIYPEGNLARKLDGSITYCLSFDSLESHRDKVAEWFSRLNSKDAPRYLSLISSSVFHQHRSSKRPEDEDDLENYGPAFLLSDEQLVLLFTSVKSKDEETLEKTMNIFILEDLTLERLESQGLKISMES